MKRIALVFLSSFLFLLVLSILPLPIPPYLDFQVIYHADMGLLRGIPVYDHTGQVNMIASLAHVSPEQVYVLPFPYPPWYALVTLPLALLPITIAARLWFGLNLLMLFASVWLLTDGWEPRKRLSSFPITLLFWPILGSLFIGQYNFPILLGASLFAYSLKNQKVGLTAIAAVLLTFKPHLGILVLLIGLIYLLFRRDEFSHRALFYIFGIGIFLFLIGFVADRAWPLNYFHSLLSFQQNSGVSSCELCASLPILLANTFNGQSNFAAALPISLMILAIFSLWIILSRRAIFRDANIAITAAILVTLLSSPYLLNYDFILLIVPFFLLAGQAHTFLEWSIMTITYLIPFIALDLWYRQGNFVFLASTFILLLLFFRDVRLLDAASKAAYNPLTTE